VIYLILEASILMAHAVAERVKAIVLPSGIHRPTILPIHPFTHPLRISACCVETQKHSQRNEL